ncbi:hypothetical protein [Qaidamihabitans albus]|uniref:hypothetical protein n=1 Tax=Qaidamihabitans albus TaxID=2795733 RepID=UPI0018F1E1E6|nr:hypothetical protein [Qaidamihabitans albus]
MTPIADREARRLRAELPKQALEYLDGNGRHENGAWATLVAIATYCLTARFVYDEFRYLVLESEFAGSTSLLAVGKREKQCQDAWEHAEDNWTEPVDKYELRALIAGLAARVAAYRWKGRAGISDRQVATAILDVCHERGTYSPVLSARYLAEKTSLGHTTVSRSLKRLTTLGLIRYRGKTEQWNSQYRLVLRWGLRPNGHNGTSSLLRSTCTSLTVHQASVPQHDAFVGKSLGVLAGRIWFTMNEPLTAAEVADRYGLAARTARRYLDALVAVGLASKGEGRPAVFKVTEVSEERLDEIAAEYGTVGWLSLQRDKHDRHREAHQIGKRLRMDATRSGYQQTYRETRSNTDTHAARAMTLVTPRD